MRSGNVMVPVEMTLEGNKIYFSFPYALELKDEIKAMDGASGRGFYATPKDPRWVVNNTPRNWFRIQSLRWGGYKGGKKENGPKYEGTFDPYERYDRQLIDVNFDQRPYLAHQREGVSFVVTRRQCILAWEMGTGKTLTIIAAMEWAKSNLGWKDEDFLFVTKGGAIPEIKLQFKEWKSQVRPTFLSYEGMVKLVKTWPQGKPAPKFVVFDESSMIKSPTSIRSEQALHLANSMRQEWGPEAFVVLMSGSPAPKNPADWWHQCEVACPGFVREGTYVKFQRRLAIIEMVNAETGGGYPKLRAWLDDENKCKTCGALKDATVHSVDARMSGRGHIWEASKNEVAGLYGRLKGFVSVKFKKDCIDLPKVNRRVVRVKPNMQTLNASKIILKRSKTAIQAMTLLRELSDGFQYKDEIVDTKTCDHCAGSGTQVVKIDPQAEDPSAPITQEALISGRLVDALGPCNVCKGQCEVDVTQRKVAQVPCPKDDALMDLIEEHEDVGRLVTFAGFTGSVDRICEVYLKMGWSVIRVDGRGWAGLHPQGSVPLPAGTADLYRVFRYDLKNYEKVAFVAQASTAGHGLNLTASPTEIFYSNDFNFESRIQAEARNDRLGIHEVLKRTGRTHINIVDIVHLDTDLLVLENHKRKRTMQAMTLGEIEMEMAKVGAEREE